MLLGNLILTRNWITKRKGVMPVVVQTTPTSTSDKFTRMKQVCFEITRNIYSFFQRMAGRCSFIISSKLFVILDVKGDYKCCKL